MCIGSIVEIVTEENVVSGIFFQDEEMRRMYNRFPEIFVDATYKLNDLCMPLYLFLVEDGNGESENVAVCMVVTEDAISIRQKAKIFKKHNRRWLKTITITADNDFIERGFQSWVSWSFCFDLLISCLKDMHFAGKLPQRSWV